MEEKKFELFAKAWLFLGQKTCEKFGAYADSMVTVPVDKTEEPKESA